jgi:hypothetical protein
MGTMLEAMKKAGLAPVHANTTSIERDLKNRWHKEWEKRCYHNRFKDIALFEIWKKTTHPGNFMEKCALCGRRDRDPMDICTVDGKEYSICNTCLLYERDNR